MAQNPSIFKCINNCSNTYSLDEVVYTCHTCGGLLEVQHDLKYLKNTSGPEWKNIFHSRRGTNVWPHGSGVWRYKELVQPYISDENIISMFEGNTNMFWAKRYGESLGLPNLWIKQCGNTHTGSFKDLGMTVLVSQVNQMIQSGTKVKAVACASTGDTSAALAAYSAFAGIPSLVFLPANKISIPQLIQPVSNGSLVISIDTDFDGCMKIVRKVTENNEIYLANSMNSLRIEGQKTISFEIAQQFDWNIPDHIIIPGGNLGNVSALGKGFYEMKELGMITKMPNIIVGQAQNANPLYQSYLSNFEDYHPVTAKTTLASAIQIGDPVSKDKAIKVLKEFNGIVEEATEEEIAETSAKADHSGLFNCPHTGVALAVLEKCIQKGKILKDETVVVISTAHGLKFSQFKVDYHTSKLKGPNKFTNPPIEVKDNLGQISKIIDAFINK